MVKASCSEFSDMESIRAGCWTSLQPSPFCMVALSPSVRHWHAASSFKFQLYSSLSCCSGSLYNFLLLGFRQWPSRADRDLTLNMNIRRPLFRTWSRARCPHSDTEVRAWSLAVHHDGHHCSDGRASEEMSQKCWAHELSKILEYNSQHCILEYNGQRWGSLTSPRKVQTASGS